MEKSRSGALVTCGKRLLPYMKWMFEHLLPYYCYATKTSRKTIRQEISQFASAGKGADMSELQSHHCMFEQINHIGTAVHGHPQLSLKCRLKNRIRFDVFDRCFCKGETRACETLRSCGQHYAGVLAVTTLPEASRSFNPALLQAHESCAVNLVQCSESCATWILCSECHTGK